MKPAPYGLFPYSPIIRRPRLTWPDGAHVALWVIPNIEFFSLTEKVPAGSGGPGTPVPDIPSWSARDYGNRVGVFRLMQLAAFRRQEVEGVPGLLQARAQPADRPRTGGVRDGRERAPNDRLFLTRRRFVEAARVAFAVTHPFPAALSTFVDDLGVIGAEVAVERDGGADAVAVERLHDAEHSHAVAVAAARPRRDVGHRRAGAAGAGRHLLRERKELDIGNHPKRHMGAIRPGQARAPDDG